MFVTVEAPTIVEAWKGLNNRFLDPDLDEQGMLIPNRDFSRVIPHVRLISKKGFGVPKDYSELPPFFHYDRRILLLKKRYIDPELWTLGVERLRIRKHRMAANNPLSFVIPFHRRPTGERKVPAGGGCLQTITFIWVGGKWGMHVHLRASEITARLVADIAFVDWAVNNVVLELEGMKKWNPSDMTVVWDIDLASQMKYMIPVFQLYTQGEKYVENFYCKWEPTSNWSEVVYKHFWDTFIWPEKVSWAQRRRWSTRFLDDATNLDWQKMAKKKITWEVKSKAGSIRAEKFISD